jgi:predicted enzyme related to lactoylglutathione lyase
MTTSLNVHKIVFTLDCPDPHALGRFYSRALGWQMSEPADDADWVDVYPSQDKNSSVGIALQRVENFHAPEWPDGAIPQQAHFDIYVPSLKEAVKIAVQAGARVHDVQPSEDGTFVVLLDPAGHPFCLCTD